MSCSTDYAPRLRSLGFRVTPQRMAILHVLRKSGSHLSPSQVFAKARLHARGITQPTVYRTLDFLARIGIAQPALDAQKHLVYQIAAHEHHHLICSRCGADVEIEHELVDGLYRDLQARSGYRLTDSHLTLFGVCPACSAEKERG
ncbi:MAG TPA: Fur family transcriptional regulator [Anaerolineales bacterium]|nr:Fur family transcriptional regulator [Anaerolineales bacterium]